MVDPNRKINRLTDRDIEFLEECEREFSMRYSAEDNEFMDHCSKPLDEPPVVENWSFGGGREGGGNDGGSRNHHRGGGNRNNRSWRGGSGFGGGGYAGGSRNYRNRRGGRGGGRYYDHNGYDGTDHRHQNSRREPHPTNRPPMDVRRDYGNFVAASKE